MLLRLALEQFLIFESAVLEMGPGIQVLTGEAGAGKSILVDALGLVTGERASADWVRAGADKLVVEAAFDLSDDPAGRAALSEAGIPQDDDRLLLLRREVSADGRSRAFANGRQILVGQLREWTAARVRIVGQGEQRALLLPHQQEDLLDRAAGSSALATRYRAARRSFLDAHAERDRLAREQLAFAGEEEWLRFQAQEIDSIDPKPGEREQLSRLETETQTRAETVARARSFRAHLLDDEGSIADRLESLLHELRRSDTSPWNEIRDRLLELRESVRALERHLPSEEDELEFDPEAAQERLRALDRLARKYGGDEEVRQHRIRVQERLDEGEALAGRIEAQDRALASRARETFQAGEELSRARREAALRLSEGAESLLAALGMPGAELRFELRREEGVPGVRAEPNAAPIRPLEGGLDHIALRFRSHRSLELGDLGRTASGGELSRVLLALHSAAGEAAMPGSWVFDEIDAGLGGETAVRVAERLTHLAERTQVLLITHLPVIAARAQRHFRIVKEEHRGRPRARVEPLSEEERLRELARMLSGDDRSEVARRHARELRGSLEGGAA